MRSFVSHLKLFILEVHLKISFLKAPTKLTQNYTSSIETNVSLFEENQSNIFLTLPVTG